MVAAVPGPAWSAPSPCRGWTAGDVLAHLVATQRSFLADRGLDLAPAPDVAADPVGAWMAHAAEVEELLARPEVVGQAYDGYFGPTTLGESMVRFYVMDMVAHRWDVARATGSDEAFTDAELDQLELQLDGYGDAAYAPGVFEPALDAPPGADRQVRLLARMGRRAWS